MVSNCMDRTLWGFDIDEWNDNFRQTMREVAMWIGDNPRNNVDHIEVSPRLIEKVAWKTREHRRSEAYMYSQRPRTALPKSKNELEEEKNRDEID